MILNFKHLRGYTSPLGVVPELGEVWPPTKSGMLSNFVDHKQLSNLRPLGEQSSWTPRSINEVPRGLHISGSIMCQNLTRLKGLGYANFQKDWTNLFFVASFALFDISNQCAFTSQPNL